MSTVGTVMSTKKVPVGIGNPGVAWLSTANTVAYIDSDL